MMELALLASAIGAGCGDGTLAAPRAREAQACARGESEKLGVPFVPMCGAAEARAEWISASALPCTGGAHDTVGCPVATPLLAEPPTTRTHEARAVALMEGWTAYRLCALRFGGRLPTSAERARARRLQGMATLIASRRDEAGTIGLEELPEWVADGPCDNPSLPGAGCLVHRFPIDAEPNIPWARVVACDVVAGTAPAGTRPVALGGVCAPGAACVVRSPSERAAAPARLACAPPPSAGAVPSALPHGVGAVRCVVPAAGLTRVSGP
ncbi:MAG: hypothetical protein IT378_07640 [Sandaracinaceae bacterium]|nr:hypothetical protein [Sandaracinaceae bacterium]